MYCINSSTSRIEILISSAENAKSRVKTLKSPQNVEGEKILKGLQSKVNEKEKKRFLNWWEILWRTDRRKCGKPTGERVKMWKLGRICTPDADQVLRL